MQPHHTHFSIKPVAFAITAVLLTSCGGGGGSTPPSLTKTTNIQMSGAVVDGYLIGATVFLDLNNNASFDAGEPNTTTDTNGSYTLTNITEEQFNTGAPIVITGGTDKDTGKTFSGLLTSPQLLKSVQADTETTTTLTKNYTLNATAITTLVQKTSDAAKVTSVLGIANADLGANPLTIADATIAKNVIAKNIAINRAVETLTNKAASGNSAGDADTIFTKLATVISENPTTTSVGNLIAGLPTDTPGADAISVAEVVANKTEALFTDVTSTTAIQIASLKASAVVSAVSGITDSTTATNAADNAITQSAQRIYLINQGINLSNVLAGDITTFDGLTIDFANQTTVTALTTIKNTSGVPTSIQTLIQAKLDEIAQLAAADAVISALKSLGITLTTADETTIKTLDATSLGGVYNLQNLASISGLPTAIKTELDRQIAAETIITTLANYEISLTEAQISTIKAINPINLNGDYSLSSIQSLSGLPTEVVSSIQTKIDEQSSSAQLNAIAGQYWQLNNTSTLEGSMTNGNSSTWSMVSLQPNLLTASVSDEQLSFTLAENGSLSIGQLIDYAGEQKTQQMRSIDPGKIASGIPATLNSDNSLSIPEITPTVGQTGSENLFGGNNYNYSITYAKSSGMMPFYKDSVTQRYAYIHLNTQAKQFGEDINNWKILETSLTLVLPKINTNTGVLANVAGHTYGGIILQSQYPTPMGTSLNLGLEIADFVVETSRWSIDPSGNLTRPASAQNAVKLKYFPNGIGLGYNGEDFPNHDSSRIDRTATVVENGNLGGTTTATWGENDNSTRQVAYTPDGMIAMLNKHHTNFDQVNPSPVYDCADSNAVIDQAINTCQLGTRLAVKLPDTGGTVTNATITDSLNGKTYRFLGMQIQGNTQGDLVELFSGPVEATFGKSGSSLTLAITQTDATSSTLRYQGEPGQVTTVEATDANASETLANPLIAFTETSDSLTEASTRLGEFELAQTGNDNESGLANGDPETMAHPPGTHIRFFMSQDGADSDTAPDVVIGAVYSENSNDATDSQRDKSVWLLMGTPAITTEPVIFLD